MAARLVELYGYEAATAAWIEVHEFPPLLARTNNEVLAVHEFLEKRK